MRTSSFASININNNLQDRIVIIRYVLFVACRLVPNFDKLMINLFITELMLVCSQLTRDGPLSRRSGRPGDRNGATLVVLRYTDHMGCVPTSRRLPDDVYYFAKNI